MLSDLKDQIGVNQASLIVKPGAGASAGSSPPARARGNQIRLRDPKPELARIQVPTPMLWGEKDGVIPIGDENAFLNGLARATLYRQPDLGHASFEAAPVSSLKPVLRFLPGET